MDKDTIINSIEEIGLCEDEAERLSKLTDLKDEIGKIFDDKTGLESEIKTLKDSIIKKDEEIINANQYAREMFLKVGEQKTASQVQSESTGIKEEKEEYKSYEELAKQFR